MDMEGVLGIGVVLIELVPGLYGVAIEMCIRDSSYSGWALMTGSREDRTSSTVCRNSGSLAFLALVSASTRSMYLFIVTFLLL